MRADDLERSARGELRTLTKENAEVVARHLVMAARMLEVDPALAHRHAMAAAGRAGRVAVVREAVALTAYGVGDFALALRELRTFRRISGSDDQIALMVDSERGVGRPDRALELGRSVDRGTLPVEAQVGLAIAMSGARLDQGDPQAALVELERAPFDLNRVFVWTPALYAAFATVHEELGEASEAERWQARADRAAEVLDEAEAESDAVEVLTERIEEAESDEDEPDLAETGDEAVGGPAVGVTPDVAGSAEAEGTTPEPTAAELPDDGNEPQPEAVPRPEEG
ncbi:hypothetical protein QDR37_13415 [Amnibacterium sp. CER49]|uniref:hypothetical protein n=1 Tax=Amnibacterium sp. CER49 TaxID=3039161 RepID=UPI002446E3F1|nr:hypothetical protein [Amnibacterium sp. CER49]MDH2444949.1 hypothetical protein [Amnibacterium sp. CER49]